MHPPQIVETLRLMLRPVAQGDAREIYRGWAGRAKATRLMNFPRHLNQMASGAWVERCLRNWQEETAFAYMIILRETGERVGSIELGLRGVDAEIGYILAEQFWGRGYATEATGALVGWAGAQRGIMRISATCHPDNIASSRVLEKAGLRLERRVEGATCWPQLQRSQGPCLVYARTFGGAWPPGDQAAMTAGRALAAMVSSQPA
ncbi:MAG: GNAT family N-acetyltransferase [Hyphomicrobiales bacterium]|nr:GNAT family N-acetyltransferase [Hyphomicrobiales bacterium]